MGKPTAWFAYVVETVVFLAAIIAATVCGIVVALLHAITAGDAVFDGCVPLVLALSKPWYSVPDHRFLQNTWWSMAIKSSYNNVKWLPVRLGFIRMLTLPVMYCFRLRRACSDRFVAPRGSIAAVVLCYVPYLAVALPIGVFNLLLYTPLQSIVLGWRQPLIMELSRVDPVRAVVVTPPRPCAPL